MSLIKNLVKLLAKSNLIPLGLKAAALATDSAILDTIFGSDFTTLIISNEEMKDIMKIFKSLDKSESLIKKRVSETIKNEAKEQKWGFLGMLLGTLGASLLRNILISKATVPADEATIRECENFQCHPVLLLILKYKNVMKINLYLIMFIQEMIYLK